MSFFARGVPESTIPSSLTAPPPIAVAFVPKNNTFDCLNPLVSFPTPLAPLSSSWHYLSETPEVRTESFRLIFEKHIWRKEAISGDPLQRSGPGSLYEQTRNAIKVLHAAVDMVKEITGKKRVRLLDIPCGDLFWIPEFLQTRQDVDYTGADIVSSAVTLHRKNHPEWTFLQLDLVEGTPESAYDLVFTRHMLQHLFSGDVLRALQHVHRSKSLFFLSTTHPGFPATELSADDVSRFRHLNLQAAPYCLSQPLCMSVDNGEPHWLALWNVSEWQLPNIHQNMALTSGYLETVRRFVMQRDGHF